jgi:hypothetical protein
MRRNPGSLGCIAAIQNLCGTRVLRALVAVRIVKATHPRSQLTPKGIAVKQPELTQLIGLQDGDGDRLFISRLDRPNGSRGYLLAIRSGEAHGSVFLTAGDLDRLSTVIRSEVGDGDDDLVAEFGFLARAIWLPILCALVWLLAYAVTGPLFAYPWSN